MGEKDKTAPSAPLRPMGKETAAVAAEEIKAEVEKERIRAEVAKTEIRDHDEARNDRTRLVKASFAGLAVLLGLVVAGVLGWNAMSTGSPFNFEAFGISLGVPGKPAEAPIPIAVMPAVIPIHGDDTDADTDLP